jgi:hypothetical protein
MPLTQGAYARPLASGLVLLTLLLSPAAQAVGRRGAAAPTGSAPAAAPPAPATPPAPPAPMPAPPSQSDDASTLSPPIVEIPPSPRRTHFFGRVSVGFAYRWAFSQQMPGATLIAELGGQDPRWAGSVRLHIEAGQLVTGLPHQVVLIGPQLWMSVHERVRIGIGLDPGMLLLSRRTMPGRSMWTVVLGGHVGATADLLRIGGSGALHAELGVGAYGLTQAPGPISVATHLGLGYRL